METIFYCARSLINRAQALVETRAKLSSQLATMEAATSREEEAVAKMNEEKMIRALNSNVKLGCLQSVFDKVVMVTALELEMNLCKD